MCLHVSPSIATGQREQAYANTSNNAGFQARYVLGKSGNGIFSGKLCVEQSEEGIVEIIQNLIDFALEGYITEEVLRQDVGIVVGC